MVIKMYIVRVLLELFSEGNSVETEVFFDKKKATGWANKRIGELANDYNLEISSLCSLDIKSGSYAQCGDDDSVITIEIVEQEETVKKEVFVVEMINGEDLICEETETFDDKEKAEKYFVKLIKENFKSCIKGWKKKDFNECLDDGYFGDDTHYAITINSYTI